MQRFLGPLKKKCEGSSQCRRLCNLSLLTLKIAYKLKILIVQHFFLFSPKLNDLSIEVKKKAKFEKKNVSNIS